MGKPVIYIQQQLMAASKKCVSALNHIDKTKSLTKTEMRKRLKDIFNHIHNGLDVPTKYTVPNMETEEERNRLPESHYKPIKP